MSRDPASPKDSNYYAARALEERRLAMAAKNPNARAAHLELAQRYAELAEQGDREPPLVIGEQQTA